MPGIALLHTLIFRLFQPLIALLCKIGAEALEYLNEQDEDNDRDDHDEVFIAIVAVVDGDLAETAAAYARDNGDLFTDDDISKLSAYYSKDADYAVLGLDGVYNTVTAAYTVTENGETLYAFVSRPYGYSNIPMAVYYVLNADGEIVMMNAKEFILEKDYFSNYTLDPQSYKEGFVGMTAETMTDDVAFISGATMTMNAVKTATHDVFDAFATLKENGGLGNE